MGSETMRLGELVSCPELGIQSMAASQVHFPLEFSTVAPVARQVQTGATGKTGWLLQRFGRACEVVDRRRAELVGAGGVQLADHVAQVLQRHVDLVTEKGSAGSGAATCWGTPIEHDQGEPLRRQGIGDEGTGNPRADHGDIARSGEGNGAFKLLEPVLDEPEGSAGVQSQRLLQVAKCSGMLPALSPLRGAAIIYTSLTVRYHVTQLAVDIQEVAVESPGVERPSRPTLLSTRLLVPLLAGIFGVLLIAGLQFASKLLVPLAVAILLTLLLGPLVRGMRKYGVAEPVGAGIIVFGTMILLGVGIVGLAAPAAEWLRRAPETLRQVEGKLHNIEPVSAFQATARSVARVTGVTSDSTPRFQVAAPSRLQQVGWTTANAIAGSLSVVFLTYFLLASGSMFRRKIAYLFPSGTHRTRIKRALFEIEDQMSRYLLFNTLISTGVGLATWAFLAVIGMPNPLLWGVVAGILNYIPYLGSMLTIVLIGIVALASFQDTGNVLLACGGYVVIHVLECNLLAPLMLGRKMPLNTVAVFVSLLFWGWIWGIAGVMMAVPLTVMIQVISSHSERFRGLAILLGNWGAQRVS